MLYWKYSKLNFSLNIQIFNLFYLLSFLDYLLENRWICPKHCGRSYKDTKQLNRHINECGVPPRFKCGKCSKSFKRNGHLKQHLMSCAGGPPAFSCKICLKKFNYKSNWKTHMAFKHNMVDEYRFEQLAV